MKIIKVPKYILPLGYGLTLYKLVLIRKDMTDEETEYVTLHEAEHVRQWTTIGFFRFPYLYIKELIKVGYLNNKYERSAREARRRK